MLGVIAASRRKERVVEFPFTTQSTANINIVTANGSPYKIDWGDGNIIEYASSPSDNVHNYSSPTSGVMRIITRSSVVRLQCNSGAFDFTNVKLLTSLTRLYLNSNSFTGNMSDVSLLTSLTYLFLSGHSFTGDMSDVKLLTSLTNLYLSGHSFTGDMSDVKLLTSLTNLYLIGNSFTGDMSDVKLLTSLTNLYLIGNSFTGEMSGVSLLTSLTNLYLRGNSFTGEMSDVKLLTSLTNLYLSGNFTINYTSTTFAPNFQRWFFRPTTAANPMSSTELDQMLVDASQTTWAGSKNIYADGNNGTRTSVSDSAVLSLQSQGVTLYLNV